MTDKVQKIRNEVERLQNELIQEKEKGYGSDADDACILELQNVLTYIDSLQEEPSLSNKQPVDEAMAEIEKKAKLFTEAHKGKTSEEILAEMRGEEPVSDGLEKASKEWLTPQLDKSYAAYGETKQMELTHFDGYAMLDAIEFGAKWQEAKDQEIIETAIHHAYHNGRLEMKQQMMANTADAMIDFPYENKDGGYTHLIDVSRPLPVGNNKIAIIFKED